MAFDYKKFYSELTKGLPGAVSPEEVDFLKGQPMPSRSDRPDLFGDLSRVPLGREQAQNTAQMGKQASDDMQEAFKSVMEGVPAFGGGAKQEGVNLFQKLPQQNPLDLYSRQASQGEKLMHLADEKGRMPLSADEIQSKGLAPLQMMQWGGSGVGSGQKSISLPQAGSSEYAQRVIEGSMPGVGALNEYQKQTFKNAYYL
jgi:hypothetical protein